MLQNFPVRSKHHKAVTAAVLTTMVIGFAPAARADVDWTGATSNDWNDPANWVGSTFPTGTGANVNLATGNFPVISATPTTGTPSDIFIGRGTGTTGRLDQTAGQAGTGNGNWMFVGSENGTGTFNLANTAVTGPGISGYGQGSGDFTAGKFWVGGGDFHDNGTGVVNINTTGTLTTTDAGGGSMILGGGWQGGPGNGTVNLEAGTVSVSGETQIGRAGTGVWNQSGGTLNSAGYLVLGREPGFATAYTAGNGTMNLTGGVVNAATGFGITSVGSSGGATGVLNVSGTGLFNASSVTPQTTAAGNAGMFIGEGWQGTATAKGTLTVSQTGQVNLGTNGITLGVTAIGDGTINLDGGTISTAFINNGPGVGTVNFNGGTLKATGDSTGFITNVTTAQVRNGAAVIDTNGFNVTVGQAIVHSAISGDNTTDGGVTKTGTGTLTLTGVNGYTGRTVVKAGTLKTTYSSILASASTPILTGGGAALEGASILQFDYTGDTSPVAQVKSLLTAGYASGFTTGQIRGQALAAGRTLGYGDNGTGLVTVRVTLPGDAELDGDVDFNDFLVLQNNFGVTGTRFDQANFNYDNVTDFNDFLALQNFFGQSVSGDAVAFSDAQVAAMTAFAANPANQAVPEPASLALIGLGVAGALRRRRR